MLGCEYDRDGLDGQFAASEQTRPQYPDEEPLVFVQVVELAGFGPEPVTNALRRLR